MKKVALAALTALLFIGLGSHERALFLQFGQEDTRPSPADGQEVLATPSAPKKARWYDGGHELNAQARTERENWLAQRLGVG
jgi:predicted esterase